MNHPTEPDYVKIIVLDSAIEAQLAASILSERNIPCRFRSYHDTAYGSLFQVQKGWGEIRAPQLHRREINTIVAEIRSGFSDSDEMA